MLRDLIITGEPQTAEALVTNHTPSRKDDPMTTKQPVQADGKGNRSRKSDGVGDEGTHGKQGGGESGGGAYPNPHRGKKPEAKPESFLGHGGQSEIGYHGAGQLGDEKVGDGKNRNSPTKSG